MIVGKRVLLKLGRSYSNYGSDVIECRVLEISPSGRWVKLMNLNGNKFWRPADECLLVETLADKIESPPVGDSS